MADIIKNILSEFYDVPTCVFAQGDTIISVALGANSYDAYLKSIDTNPEIIIGASVGFSKVLEFKGVGYKIALKGNKLDMVIGFSHNVEYDLPAEVKAEVLSPTELKLTSANKELLGLVASEIRSFRVPEPYKGKGIRYSDEYVRRKEGKKK